MNLITKHCIAFLGLITVSLGLANHCQAHDTAKEFSDAAAIFLKSLDDDQTKAVQFKFDDPLRKDWHFIPKERKGLSLKQMKPHQRGLAMALVPVSYTHLTLPTKRIV